MTKGRKYFHFPKSVPGASDFVSTLQQDKYNEPALEAAANAIGQPTEQYPHVKKPPRAENRTQPGKEKTVYAQLIEIRESVAAIAKIPRSNVQKESIEPEEQYKWTKSLSLRIVGDNDELRRQLNQPVQLPILIPANSSLGRGWIDKYQYPRVWSEIFPYFTSGKINVQPYEKDEDKVATDAIRLNHLEDAMSKKRDDRGRPYNCLDLHDQIGIHIFPHEIDEVNAIRVTDSDCTGRAKKNDPKASDLTFNILSMRDSFTPPHVDAGGYLTYVHMVKGKKVWYLLEKTLPEMDTEAKGLMREGGITMLTEKMDLEWSRVLLTKGDSLILPAGSPHCVDTITDSFAVGGHFIANNSLHLGLSSFASTSAIEHITNEEVRPLVLEAVMSLDLRGYPEPKKLYNAIKQLSSQKEGPVWTKFKRRQADLLANLLTHAREAGNSTSSWGLSS